MLKELDIDSEQQSKLLSEGLAQYFLTINEPAGVLYNGYLSGIYPPFKRLRLFSVLPVLNKLVEAHDIATTELKEGLCGQKHQPQVGVAYNWQYYEGLVGKVTQEFHEYCTHCFEREGGHSDLLGLDYYFRYKFLVNRGKREYGTQPSFGDIYPRGIMDVLKALHLSYPKKPIFVTEFGFADVNDLRRPYWMLETVRYILEAKKSGIPVTGVLVWTLVNNFEWELGMSQKFGLFEEAELDKPLLNSGKGIRSWEAWRAAIKAIRLPNPGNLTELQMCYERARQQYKEAGGRL
jgi:beta-glucosidase